MRVIGDTTPKLGIFNDGWKWFGMVIMVNKEHHDSVSLEMNLSERDCEVFGDLFLQQNTRLYAIKISTWDIFWFKGKIIKMPVRQPLYDEPRFIRVWPEIWFGGRKPRFIGGTGMGEMTPYEELRYNWDRTLQSYVNSYYHDVWFTSHCFEMGWW